MYISVYSVHRITYRNAMIADLDMSFPRSKGALRGYTGHSLRCHYTYVKSYCMGRGIPRAINPCITFSLFLTTKDYMLELFGMLACHETVACVPGSNHHTNRCSQNDPRRVSFFGHSIKSLLPFRKMKCTNIRNVVEKNIHIISCRI